METWREELYHAGIFSNLRTRAVKAAGNVKNAIASKSSGSKSSNGKGREWANHKYIRKEGTRYIYPEDLKKKSSGKTKRDSEKVDVNTDTIKRTYTDKYYGHGQHTLNRYMPKLNFQRLSKPNDSTLIGEEKGNAKYRYSSKLEKDIRDAHGSDNKIREMEQIYEGPNLGWNSTVFSSDVKIVNGEKWFKSEINVTATKVTTNMGSNGITKSTAATYTISYSKSRQLLNKGKAFIDSLKKKKNNK